MFIRASIIIIAFAVCFFAPSTRGQSPKDSKKSVELLPRWKKGEKVQFEMVKTRKDQKDGKTTQTVTVRTDIEIEILNATKDGSELRWTTGDSKFDDPKVAKNPIIVSMTNLLKGFHVVIELDADASIKGVKNWKEVKDKSVKLVETMTEELEKAGQEKRIVDTVRALAATMFATKDQVEQLCTREPQLFFFVLGKTYSLGKPLEFDGALPNPLGGESIPGRVAFTWKAEDVKSGHLTFGWRQTLDPKAAKRIMEKTLKDIADKIGRPVPDGDLIKNLTIEDVAETTVDPSSGWVLQFTHTRTVTIGNRVGQEITTINRKLR